MTRGGRILAGTTLTICAAVSTKIVVAFAAVRFAVPPDSGLAGPPAALGYGLVGSCGAAIYTILLSFRLPSRALQRLTLATVAAAALALAMRAVLIASQEPTGHFIYAVDPDEATTPSTPTQP